MTKRTLRIAALFGGIAAAVLIATVATAESGAIHACVHQTTGAVRIVSSSETCDKNTSRLSWSQAGAAGPAGPAGLAGPAGTIGPIGPSGTTGPAGATGPAGLTGPAGTTGQWAHTGQASGGLMLIPSSTTFALVPGLSLSLNVPANTVVYVASDGGVAMSGFGKASVEVAIFVDGVRTQGGLRRVSVAEATTDVDTWAISLSLQLPAGTHTVDVRTRHGSTTGSVMVSGGAGSALQGELTALVLKK